MYLGPEMKTQDVILNKEKLVKTIYDLESARCLQDDKNCELLLNFLLETPMTFEDIKMAFKGVNAEKSDKTIYGYLNRLKKSDLVMEAGKRIITYSESQIKTLTLYSRTAKVFYVSLDISKSEGKKSPNYADVIGQILCQLLNFKSFDNEQFEKFFFNFSNKKRVDIEQINKIDQPEILDQIIPFDVRATKFIIDTICWLVYIGENPEVYNEFIQCFKK
ncbi:MAG: hypothetical protein JXA54_16170 [Candidatus Heimdallarchaeota archaeon]|nr:hypothetical protein [Candidatus Heimdallarchaeota archaeon]